MALARRLALGSLRQGVTSYAKPSRSILSVSRLFSTSPIATSSPRSALKSSQGWKSIQQARTFSSSIKLRATQEAPSAQAYLASGAIAGARNLVDVTKVLVIGSGGLSIGQAGEFDYSGRYRFWGGSPVLSFEVSHEIAIADKVLHNRLAGTQGS